MDNRHFLLGSFNGEVDETSKSTCLSLLSGKVRRSLNELQDFAKKAWDMGRSDPRKIIFAIKMGMALSIVSLLIFCKAVEDISQYSIWAILTVIVMFEYTIGATFIKGFNRLLGTLCAGMLAFGFAELSLLVGKWEEVVIVISIFITGFFASYLKLYPTMKPYEYGFRVFVLTYCILMVAGNRTREYTEAVVTRLVLIALGACVCLVVNVCVYPIWSGDALHSMVVKNFKDVANSVEGCVNGYLKFVEYERFPSRILTYQSYDDPLYNGYRSVVESTSKEENLLGFAIWEPPHGRFKMFNYPWRNYVEVCGALRHCAFMVMALHGCILSEIQVISNIFLLVYQKIKCSTQNRGLSSFSETLSSPSCKAPAARRQVFQSELRRVGAETAKVLRELGSKFDKMEKLCHEDILKEVHEAAEQLQRKIDERSYLLIARQPRELHDPEQNPENKKENKDNMQLGSKSLSETVLDLRSVAVWTPISPTRYSSGNLFRKQAPWPSSLALDAGENECRTYESASALSLATFASLLIECVARLQSLVEAFEELSEKAEFMEPIVDYAIAKKKARFCGRLFGCLKFSN
ncbi:aluminum-activated malate transporter 5 isoform X1 [Ricinus communis]|uniref:aluminum-activated malate transporter 5 isoform X1 n=1 Tax=Ricinus communis TaxID=3988 RepID=UPI000D6855B5|nr:aluminum-activated malate transporter 5 isoform X1 [Ricinus communis]XP_025014887.1 aluminum-activated malate transporter 5 isoform X1 [Ricinus communis]XP_048228461.1 aluminum-activated malate transporter 5 isoform X1 [Ricinus communis]XP_048228462.1 aluminum-activated malate transporter 5 isoform X1 [Ricinus communis]XP_048228463.1 aluminum-activated malate transporter 5 isoform X1 [Ricinus communis]XP_048228464.1 aluminum-activated malate transporter 5 isoform X1 [Ricinus communis]|eukprot:XP_025014886.1 aluminum-activated malate transporter 5 isoform X1 [Ricinus communis]